MNNLNKIDQIIQYALAVAGQNESFERKLGMIHLIKYVYLADLMYAKYHNGETFTGLRWTFHHFGPWSVECYNRVEPALLAIGAKRMIIEGEKYGDFVRWEVSDEDLFQKLTNELDLTVAGTVQKYVRLFGSDTYGLLDFVYKTEPMVRATPEEILDFRSAAAEEYKPEFQTINIGVTERQKKKQRKQLSDFKRHLNERLEAKVSALKATTCQIPPRYDDIYLEGLAKLDEDEAPASMCGDFTVVFADNVWKSRARHDPELS